MMNKTLQWITTISLFLSSGATAVATELDEVDFAAEARTCIAAVNENADYRNAVRVQHHVVELNNTLLGYVLNIDTKVFVDSGDIAMKEYSSYCMARGDHAPSKFNIRDAGDWNPLSIHSSP